METFDGRRKSLHSLFILSLGEMSLETPQKWKDSRGSDVLPPEDRDTTPPGRACVEICRVPRDRKVFLLESLRLLWSRMRSEVRVLFLRTDPDEGTSDTGG